jgi:pyruvate dehydrogenase E2 component (dihydrolipoamide acetyltransferase)
MGMYEFRLPELGEGLHEGRIEKWVVKPGDTIQEDDVLAEVENDKSLVELFSPVAGKVLEIKAAAGSTVVVGDILVTLEVEGAGNIQAGGEQDHGHAAPQAAAPAPAAAPAAAPVGAPAAPVAEPAPAPAAASALPSRAQEVLATPGVRKYARDHGVDIANLTGTGNHGKVTQSDVDAFLAGGAQAAAATSVESGDAGPVPSVSTSQVNVVTGEEHEERVPLTTIRKRIAEAMVHSKHTAPHVTIMDEVNVGQLVAFRNEVKPLAAERGVKVTYLPFVVKALVAALKLHPQINSTLDDEHQEMVYKHYYHIGIATDTDRGLLVPVIRHADKKNMWTIASEITDLATRGRSGKLTSTEMKGSTISITNIGSAGGMFFTPIINYPEVAILGVGRITEKPVIENGAIVPGHMMALSLSVDHRVIDGALAQRFVNDIKRLLENPRLMLMEV